MRQVQFNLISKIIQTRIISTVRKTKKKRKRSSFADTVTEEFTQETTVNSQKH